MGIITDDGEALETLRKTNKLPQNRYQSLSVLVDDTRRPPISQNEALFQFGSYEVKTRLHPPVSNLGTYPTTKTSVIQGPPLRIPPVPFDEMFPPIESGRSLNKFPPTNNCRSLDKFPPMTRLGPLINFHLLHRVGH